MSDKYDYCKISTSSKQCSINELNEDPNEINNHIDQLRNWAISMPHLSCPMDSDFMLRFLRSSKFDMKAAQKQLDSFCTVRCSHRGYPEYFNYSNIDDEMINKFLDSEMFAPLGRNNDGEIIIFAPLKYWDPDTIPRNTWMTLFFMGYELIQCEEETQIHGVRLYFDMTDTSEKIADVWTDNKFLKDVAQCFQDIFPWRFKLHLLYNLPEKYDNAFKMWSFHMSKFFSGKIIRTNNLEEAFQHIPGLKELLPVEYGGCGGPLKPHTERWKQTFKEQYKNQCLFKDIAIDESIRHEETLNYLDEYPDYSE